MKILLILFSVLSLTCSNSFYNNDITGHWEGYMECNGNSIPLSFNISENNFKYDIPGLGLFDEKIDDFKIYDKWFKLIKNGIEKIIIEGSFTPEEIHAEIEGIDDLKIHLNKMNNEPLFYIEENVSYTSFDGNKLSGTLIKPINPSPYPVIIYVHGSGAMDRSSMRNRASMLVHHGIAALIFDRRGKGISEGDTSRILPVDIMTKDVIAGVNYLKSRDDINTDLIGIYGLSQGGWVAPNAASLCRDIKFLITVSAPGITPDEQNDFVVQNIIDNKLREIFKKNIYIDPEKFIGDENKYIPMSDSAYETVKGFSKFDPVPVWEKINIPVLALWGSDDELVPAMKSKSIIELALKNAGNKNATLKVFQKADHTLRSTSKDNLFAGKWKIITPGANDYIADWVISTCNLKK